MAVVAESTDAEQVAGREYAKSLGLRLRAIRAQQHLSLHGVERKSGGRWKAVVVGSYERGDRAISVQRLAELADFYGVPVSELMPHERPGLMGGGSGNAPLSRVVLNLTRLSALTDAGAAPLTRFVAAIQRQRGEYGNRALAIRQADLTTLAMIYDTTDSGMTERLVRWQVLAPESLILDGEP